jgi:hypothetical protein
MSNVGPPNAIFFHFLSFSADLAEAPTLAASGGLGGVDAGWSAEEDNNPDSKAAWAAVWVDCVAKLNGGKDAPGLAI